MTPKGQVQAQVAGSIGFNSSAVSIVDEARNLDKSISSIQCPNDPSRQCFRVQDFRALARGGFRLALLTPVAQHVEFSLRYGLLDGLDLGGHLGSGTTRLDAGYQIFGPRDPDVHGWAGSLFVGWNRYSGNFASDLLEKLGGNASRWDLDALFITGRQWNDYLHTYFGARYMLSRWSLELLPSLPLVYDSGEVQQTLLGTDEAGASTSMERWQASPSGTSERSSGSSSTPSITRPGCGCCSRTSERAAWRSCRRSMFSAGTESTPTYSAGLRR